MLDAFHAGHPEIGDDQVDPSAAHQVERLVAVPGLFGLDSQVLQETNEHLSLGGIVFDDQNSGLSAFHLRFNNCRLLGMHQNKGGVIRGITLHCGQIRVGKRISQFGQRPIVTRSQNVE